MNTIENNNCLAYEEFLLIQKKSKERIEYYNGKIINMSPTSIKHNEIVTNLNFELKKYFKGSKCKVYSEQVAVLFELQNEKREFLPDVFVMCEDSKTKGEKFITPPKIIFEVVSREYAGNDYFVKSEAYQKFGVLEYNIVEQNGNIVQYKLENNLYYIANTYHRNDMYRSVVFEELKIDLNDIFEY